MNVSMRSSIAAALVVGALIPVASATAAPAGEPQVTQANNPSSVVLRRDASEAAPFVATVGPEATATAGQSTIAGSDGFDWGAAAVGAGGALAATLALGATVRLTIRKRSETTQRAGMSPSASTS